MKSQIVSQAKLEALILAQTGFAHKYIAKQTGNKLGRVKYLCKKYNVKVTEFRNGETELSRKVRKHTKELALNYLQTKLLGMKKVKELREKS